MGRLDLAADARLRGLALDPLNARLRAALGEEYFYGGRWDDALAALQRAAQLDPLHPILLGRANAAVGPGRVYLAQGREADGVRDLLRVAALSAFAGDSAQALTWLEHAYAERNPGLIFMRTDPSYASLRMNPRYRRIERAMRFPPR